MIRNLELDDAEAFKLLFHDLMLTYRGLMPAIVESVNKVDGKVFSLNVQPAISQRIVKGNGFSEQRLPIIPDVPLVLPYAPTLGLSLTLPIKKGDDCIIICADRSIDNWQWNGGVQQPVESATPRMFSLSDAVCIPGAITRVSGIENYSEDSIEIRNSDATTAIKINDTEVSVREKAGATALFKDEEITLTAGDSTATLNDTSITLDNGTSNTVLDSTSITHTAGTSIVSMTSTTVDVTTTTYTVNATTINLNGAISGGGGGGAAANFTGTLSASGNISSTSGEVSAGSNTLTGHTHTEQGDGNETSGPNG